MARCAGLPWDTILGAESTGHYKPLPQAYLGTADILGLRPGELCLVEAHHSDLAAARACGLMTAHVARPMEYGGRPAPDRGAAQAWDHEASDLVELAERLTLLLDG
jgi:2-haloacid dehalogenase